MMKQEHRKYVAALIAWFAIANLLYFSNIKEVAHGCNEITGWLSLWIPFTFGIKEIFPYAIDTHTSGLSYLSYFCSQNFLFDEIGYGYFLLMPVAVVVGSCYIYKWAFNKSSSATTVK